MTLVWLSRVHSVPTFPQEDHKLRATSLERRRGGNVANSLEVLQQLQNDEAVELNLLCVLPSKSAPGTHLVAGSFGPNVSLSHCVYRESHHEPASSFIIKSRQSDSRTIVNYNELPEMSVLELRQQTAAMLKGTDDRTWFHFEGRECETNTACIRWLREQHPNVLISVEAEKPNRPGLEAMAAEADVVFFSKAWAESIGHSDVAQFLQAQARVYDKASLLCCTWGSAGAAAIRPSDGLLHQEPAYIEAGRRVVDTIGAGDTFVAGVLHMLTSGGHVGVETHLQRSLAFANKLAGRKVMQEGFDALA